MTFLGVHWSAWVEGAAALSIGSHLCDLELPADLAVLGVGDLVSYKIG